jgi:hypothetical protein
MGRVARVVDFLRLNRIPVPVEQESGFSTDDEEEHIDRIRSFSMDLVETERSGRKRVWSGTTSLLTAAEASAFAALIRGEGSVVSFDHDALSSRGHAPASGSNYTRLDTGGVEDSGYATVATGDFLRYRADLGAAWTVLFQTVIGETISGIARSSAPLTYASGAVASGGTTAAVTATLAVDGTVTISDDTDIWDPVLGIDELTWLPYAAPASWLAIWSQDAELLAELPELTLDGLCLRGGDPVYVRGSATVEEAEPFMDGGVWQVGGCRVSFDLQEIGPAVVASPPAAAPTISYAPTTAIEGEAYTLSPTTTGATSFALTAGTLPDGLSLNTSTGVISGTPTSDGTASGLVVTATGAGGSTASAAFSIVVAVAVTVSYSPTTATEGEAYTLTPTTTGATSFALTSGTLPTGLTLDTGTGVISGTPTTEETASGLVVTATGAGGSTASASFSIVVEAAAASGWDGTSAIDEGSTWEALQVVETVAADADMTNVAADLTINSLLVTPSFSYAKRSHASSLTINAAAMAELVGAADDARPLLVVLDAPSVTFSESATIPRRPFVRFYVTGTATISESVTLTVRGANHSATGSDLTAVEIRDITGTFDSVSNPSVPAAGGAGGASLTVIAVGNTGAAGTGGGLGGGGSGAASGGTSGAGAAGTAYTGGTGGGGESGGGTGGGGAARGGVGGAAAVGATGDRGAGGGGGNPGGDGAQRGAGVGNPGASFTAGDFGLFAAALAGAGTITAPGPAGGSATGLGRGGGGGGGGHVSAYVESSTFTGSLLAPGGAGGTGNSNNGGAGGLGTARELTGTLP